MHPIVDFLALVLLLPAVAWAQNQPPTANAGPDKDAFVGQAITLKGSATDPKKDPAVCLVRAIAHAQADSAPSYESPGVLGVEVCSPGEIFITCPTTVFAQAVFCSPHRSETSVAAMHEHRMREIPLKRPPEITTC